VATGAGIAYHPPTVALDRYRAKRSAERTPEPFGGSDARPRLFCVQKHAARRLHWDFRLEHEGVLWSWAVPKGPSLDPAEKRLAVHVEDHPVEYADFEGVIPKDNYGAGAVIVWDKGRWVPLDDPAEGIEKGKLLFELFGFKLRGVFTLVRIKGSAKDWLLIKKPDGFADATARPLRQESVQSGRTLEQVEQGRGPGDDLSAELAARGVPRGAVSIDDVGVMLAETRDRPFSRQGWLFELKYDGFRLLAAREGAARLRYRRGHDATATFPEIARAVSALPVDRVLLDGEVVVLDEQGKPDFQRLQRRVQLRRRPDIERAAVELPATLVLFDLLSLADFDLRGLPLRERKDLLRRILPPVGPLRYLDHVEGKGEALFAEIRRMGLEGMMAKRADSPYRAARSADWQKIRIDRTGDFVVVGFTMPQGSRAAFGALHLAVHGSAGLTYAGRVGTGFDDRTLADLRARLDALRRPEPPCAGPVPRGRAHVWVEPRLCCEVRYKEWTDEGLLRQPVFLRLRDDKAPEGCTRQDEPGDPPPAEEEAPRDIERHVAFTNLQKVFWPDEGYTKGDLIEFYRSVAPFLLPYLRDRPVVLTRFPDGIAGKSFFQKDAPGFVPGWLRTERMWSEHAARELDAFVCDDVESLLYLANMGSIPLHVWSSRVGSLERPDWCILDLDPKGAPFAHVVKVARAIRGLCEEIGLPSFVKTSGQAGLHVLLPLSGQCTHEQSRQLAEVLARLVVEVHPDIATVERVVSAREGRVYVDFLQNGHGRTIASPLSVRPQPGAPVSTPLRWAEVGPRLDPAKFTIRTVPARLARNADPLRPVLDTKADLVRALGRLSARLGGEKR
jgi:bifunctional non-homologous end joining protein LigD